MVAAVRAYRDWQEALAREGKGSGLEDLGRFGGEGCLGFCGQPGGDWEYAQGCAPTHLHRIDRIPRPGGLLLFLLPLQIALAGLAMSRRRHGDDR